MRNLKKILALVLAMVMTFSVMATANAFTDDKDVDATYEEAIEVLSGLKVFEGFEDGSFQPKGNITRAQVAAIIYRVVTGDVTNAQVGIYADYNKFTDVKSTAWYAGYVNFCANAEYIKGYGDGTFGPDDQVTGYQALAMILRAIGYDKNGEFTGSNWQVQTAAVGKKLGITDNITAGTLGTVATREVVAEILFQTIANAKQVEYTLAFSYQSIGKNTLGYDTFGLSSADTQDTWGRPGVKWTATKPAAVKGTVATIYDTPVATYTTKVDECDIAKDLGLTKAAAIEAAYIDAVNTTVTNAAVTTDRNGKIDPLATTSLVGAQGCLTEVYNMGTAGYRFVEINTYLAQVTKVTAATTDRNGHVNAATVDLQVYLSDSTGTSFTGVKATGYTVDQYVLVNVNCNSTKSVESIQAATVTPMGQMKNWTPAYGTVAATTTIASTVYNDAEKFYLGNSKIHSNNTNWDVITDTYGNLIGLVASTVNYLVVEKIEWEKTSTFTGKAVADLVLATGEKVSGATVAKINGSAASATYTVSGTYVTGAVVADSYVNNTTYYNHIYTYSVNTDGNYEIVKYCGDNVTSHNAAAVTLTNGKTSNAISNTAIVDSNTKFLVKNKAPNDVYSYSVYVGINELPSMTVEANKLCYLSDGSFATLVVINDYTLASNSFTAYAAKQNGYATGYTTTSGKPLYAYTVYPVNSTEATTIYSTDTGKIGVDGFYTVVKTADGVATTVTQIMGAYGAADHMAAGTYKVNGTATKVNGLYWDRGYTKAFNGETLVNGTAAENGDFYNSYRVTDSTKYYTVTKTTWSNGEYTVITASEASDLAVGDRIVVAYSAADNGTADVASYVYILKAETYTQYSPSTPAVVTGIQLKDDKSAGVTLSKDVKVGDTYVITLSKLTSGGYVKVADFNATIQGNTKFAWVDLSSVISSGETYMVSYGTYTDYRAF